MRTSRIALTVCTGLMGIGAFVSQAMPAQADPKPMVLDQSGDSIEVDIDGWTTPTTKPAPEIPEMQFVPPADEPTWQPPLSLPQDGDVIEVPAPGNLCTEETPNCDDTPEVPCSDIPDTVCPPEEYPCDEETDGGLDEPIPVVADPCPGEDDCPEQPGPAAAVIDPSGDDCCLPTPGGPDPCPGDEDPCEEPILRDGDADPCCRPEDDGPGQAARNHCDETDPCVPERPEDGPQRSNEDDCCPTDEDQGPQRHLEPGEEDPCDEGGTDGTDGTDGSDGTSTDGGGRLPKTGVEMATYALAGLGLTGFGALLKKVGRKDEQEAEAQA